MYDIIIIGAGVAGCAVARELSRYELDICVVEKESDVCEGTSKANSGIIHAGFDAAEGTLMAKLNVQGNQMMEKIAEDLDIPFRRNGSLVCCQNKEEVKGLEVLLERGRKNGVEGLKIVFREELLKMEPNIADTVYAALYAPTGGIVCPFIMTIAYAENAAANGVEFRRSTKVEMIKKTEKGFDVITDQGVLKTKYVINAAGVYADLFHNMVSKHKINITPRRGEYCLFDKETGDHISHTIFQLPGKMGKGVLVTPTIHGNLMTGPTSVDIEDKENCSTTAEGLSTVLEKSARTVKNIPVRQVITSFTGIRAHEDGHEFIIKELEDVKGFIDVAGIESPGLSSAPAIGIYVRDIVKEMIHPKQKEHFIEKRKGMVHFTDLTKEEQSELIQREPEYGQIVCRCETVTEGEIIDAIHRPVGATTLDGIKRRTRAGSGRCQGGFCTEKVMEILSRELNKNMDEICKNRDSSRLILGINKDRL